MDDRRLVGRPEAAAERPIARFIDDETKRLVTRAKAITRAGRRPRLRM